MGTAAAQVSSTAIGVDPQRGAATHDGGAAFAGFLARTGHRVLRAAGVHWYDASAGFFLSLPSHRQLCPSAADLRALFRHQPCAGVRFPAPLDGPGKLSYQIVCDDPRYDLAGLSANARSKVRRGLKRCEVRATSLAAIAAAGLAADRDTLARQGRGVRLDGPAWRRFWDAAAATPGMEGWGAFVGDELAAFLVSVQVDDCVELMLARSRSDRLDMYPNNALIFTVTRLLLGDRGVRQVTFGLESLEPVGPLDQFKFGMGFRAAPLRQRVVLHPLLRALLAPERVRVALHRWAERRGAPGGFWRKGAGLVGFAEAGGEWGVMREVTT